MSERTRSLGVMVAAVAWAGVVMLAGACQGGPEGTTPVRPSLRSASAVASPPSTAQPTAEDAESIVAAPNATSFDSAVDGRGDLLTIWSAGYDNDKPTALAIRPRDGESQLMLGDPGARVVASLQQGWLLSTEKGTTRVDGDGTSQQLPVPRRRTGTIEPGDVAYPGPHDSMALYRPSLNASFSIQRLLDQVHGRGAVIASDGALVTLVRRDATVEAARRQRGLWTYTPLGPGQAVGAGEIAGQGQSLIAVTTNHPAPVGDGAEDPLSTISVSEDGGQHWRTSGVPAGESVVLSMAVTQSGTGFVSMGSGSCSLLRFRKRGTAECVGVPTIQVFAHANRVYSTYFAGRRVPYRFMVSTDQGRTWHRISVPNGA